MTLVVRKVSVEDCPPPAPGCFYEDAKGSVYLVAELDRDLVLVCFDTDSVYGDAIIEDESGDFVWSTGCKMVRKVDGWITVASEGGE